MLAIRELKKTFGRNLVVDGLDLDVAAGRAVALWGANGAGKTTVIKCILGLHRFRGSIHVAGHDARRAGKAARRLIGYVSQEQAFFDDLTARETLQLFARLKHVPLSRAAAALAWVDLSAHARKRAGQLSGGMRQRLALAVALLADPPLLLLDEPASNLDAAARRQFLDLLLRLKQGGKTILFTTHRPEEVEQLADHVVVLERGRVRAAGSPQALESLISGGRRLRLALPAEQLQPARELLARAGFEVSLNCTALWVRVRAARNAAPLALLARSGLDVERIDFETGDAP